MNKQLEEGKQFANDVEDLKRILNSTAPVDVDAKGVLCLMLWCGKLIDKIEKLEAENKRFREALFSVQLLNAEGINGFAKGFIWNGARDIRRAQEVIRQALKESE